MIGDFRVFMGYKDFLVCNFLCIGTLNIKMTYTCLKLNGSMQMIGDFSVFMGHKDFLVSIFPCIGTLNIKMPNGLRYIRPYTTNFTTKEDTFLTLIWSIVTLPWGTGGWQNGDKFSGQGIDWP